LLIANCGALHLDWSRLSLSAYFEAMEAHNEANEPGKSKSLDAADAERLDRFNKAHGVG
jgi:hypothetical protein